MSTIIVKKVKKGHHGHHGGAWKIAYADFVTAMMAFFLLMWLISMTTQEQKVGLAEFFAPSTLAFSNKGAAGPLGGKTLDDSSNKSSTLNDIESGSPERGESARPSAQGRTNNLDTSNSDASAQANLSAMASLQQALQTLPDIAELSHNIFIKPTKDGVNVSLVDENGRAMFRDGSAQPYDHTRRILDAIAPALRKLPNRLMIAGHTSASRPGSAPTEEPWSLTTKRALAFRDILSGAGVPDDHFASVEGRADTEPVLRDAPTIAPNRRVTITLLNASSPVPTDLLRLK